MKKKLLGALTLCLLSLTGMSQTLVSASPNTAEVGTTLSTTVTAAGTFFMNSSPQGYIQSIYIQQGATSYYADFWSGLLAIDDTHASAIIPVPSNAPVGVYDLHVEYFDQGFNYLNLLLTGGVTVVPSDGLIEGNVFYDINGNGVKDGVETGVNNQFVSVTPLGNVITNANGDFNAGVLNGSHTVTYITATGDYLYVPLPYPASYNVTTNNDTSAQNNFALTRALTSTYPDSAYIGQNITLTIFSKGTFRMGNVQAGNVKLTKTGGSANPITATQVNFVDSNTITASFVIPNNISYLGNYDLRIYTSTYRVGWHYLINQFSIGDAPVYLSGIVYFDTDSNGIKAPTESGIQGAKISLMPDNINAISDVNGEYFFGTVPGNHTITYLSGALLPLSAASPSSYVANVSSSTSGYDFGIKNSNGLYSDSISLGACWSGCVHPNNFYIHAYNISNLPYDGYVYMVLDTFNMTIVSSIPPTDSIIGNIAYWGFNQLGPFNELLIKPRINTPIGGDTIQYSVGMVSFDNLGNPALTVTDNNVHVVNCSFDPNEKYVQPAGILPQHLTLKDQTLLYTVVFQNTGTDTAYTVFIRDTIDTHLDLNTLQVLNSSHAVNTEISPATRVVKFTFNNILLVDSNHNEPESHGFVRYTISPVAGVADSTVVYNWADIYFDFNLPVRTNTTFNTLVTALPVGVHEYVLSEGAKALVIPNPFRNEASLVFDNNEANLYQLKVFDVTGKLLQQYQTRSEAFRLQGYELNSGIYFYQLKNTQNGKMLSGKFVVE